MFEGWQGAAPPLAYRVSSTSGDNLKLQELSNGWTGFSQGGNTNFSFTPTNSNPIIVEITDYTEEIYS